MQKGFGYALKGRKMKDREQIKEALERIEMMYGLCSQANCGHSCMDCDDALDVIEDFLEFYEYGEYEIEYKSYLEGYRVGKESVNNGNV